MVAEAFATNDSLVPWGDLAPADWRRRATLGMVRSGVSRGKVRSLLKALWDRSGAGGDVDIQRFGVKWRLAPSKNYVDWLLLFASKLYDQLELGALVAAATGGLVVDIGANIGFHTLLRARSGARVLALEPNPLAFRRLSFHVHVNGLDELVATLPLGVVDEGEVALNFTGLGSGSTIIPRPAGEHVAVNLSPLAATLSAQGVARVNAIKIDVEGAEDRALIPFFRDWPESEWPQCVVLEHKHCNWWKTDVVSYLTGVGYQVTQRTNQNLILRI